MEIGGSCEMDPDNPNVRRRKRGSEKMKWKLAGPDMIPQPKSCPKAIVEYPSIRNTRQHPLVDDVRSHLVYLGWKIEYLSGKGVFRYTSPEGNLYLSLRQVCQDLIPTIGDISPGISQEDQTNNNPLLAAQENDTASSPDDKKSDDGVQISDPSPPGEAGYYPEAAVYWYKHGLEKNRQCHFEMKSKAKKHLLALGWSCTSLRRSKGVMLLRYTSPSGKNCNSLRTACKVCMDEGGVSEAVASADDSPPSAESNIIRPRRDDYSIQVGSQLPEIGASSSSVKDGEKEHQVRGKRIKLIPILRYPYRRAPRPQIKVPSHPRSKPHTVLSWLMDNNVVTEWAKVHYRDSQSHISQTHGWLRRDGVKCSCCYFNNVFTTAGFEVHVGSKEKRPSANIILEDGRSLLECQRQLLWDIKARSSDRKEKDKGYSLKRNDDICSVCRYGGHIMLCDSCPSAFHPTCLGLKEVPEGEWVCPPCRCRICGKSKYEDTKHSADDDMVRVCDQCEHKFHMGCVKERRGVIELEDYSQNKWFCSDKCENVFSTLGELLGKAYPVGFDDITWTILKSMEEDHLDHSDPSKMERFVENQSKLNVVLGFMRECFEPVPEMITGQDIIEGVIFNRRSKLNRLNFGGFYTVVVEKDEELISVATIRVYDEVAEMPLIATRYNYRRHGIGRIMMNAIEKQLLELGVERLILPAVPAVLEMWTTKFGFSKMTDTERLQFLDYTFLDFQHTSMCYKLLG